MKLKFSTQLRLLVISTVLLARNTLCGPPLQGEIPIGLYPTGEDEVFNPTFSNSAVTLGLEETYRLPLSVQPIHYSLEIRPILDNDNADPGEQFTAPGRVGIRVKCFERTNFITLHSQEIEIYQDQITVVDLGFGDNIVVSGYSVDEERAFYIIQLGSFLEAGKEYLVNIPFTSLVGRNRLNGLYLSSYKDPDTGADKYLATTQFQKRDASKMFPCFDEPSTAFRATFDVRIGRKADGFHSLANTERVGDPQPIPGLDGWVWDTHATTVNMPPYLIAIIVSDFQSETAPEDLYRLPVKTWAAPPLITETSGKFSAQAAARILSFFEEYFDYPYQLSKMDSVAIPDFAAGAMENWGLNTYRTNLMVWFEEENTRFERWRSAAVIAHELTHQWFGNLVTCEWWHDTWLNEGFARYFQFIAANHSAEDFRSLDRYVIDTVQLSMAYDETETTEPVHSNITDRIVNQASRVAYEKAASLIRMMQSFLTEETLIKGLRVYLKRHEYSGVGQDDLFTALTEQAVKDGTFTDFTVKEIMDTWTLQSGFPIVRVSRVDTQRLYISQERFRLDPTSTNDQLWYVPISYVTASNPDFSVGNTRPKAWIDKNTLLQSLPVDSADEWVIINPDARGYYRVIYDSYLTQLIQEQLERDHSVISFGSRSQLIDDYFRSASAKYINIQHALNLTRYLSKELDFIVWTTVVNNFSPLNTRLTDTDAYTSFKEYILSLVVEPLTKIGVTQLPTEHVETVVLRTMLMDFACAFGHQICKDTAEGLFAEWISAATPPQKIPVATDLQPMIYCGAVAAASSDDPTNTTIQDFLLEEYVRNRDARQQTLIVNALACDQAEVNLARLLEKAIDTSAGNELSVGTHGLPLLQSIARNSVGRQLLLDFVKEKQSEITSIHGQMAVATLISTLTPYLSSNSVTNLLEQVELFAQELLELPNLPSQVRSSLQSSLATISQNSAWMSYYYDDVKNWLLTNV